MIELFLMFENYVMFVERGYNERLILRRVVNFIDVARRI